MLKHILRQTRSGNPLIRILNSCYLSSHAPTNTIHNHKPQRFHRSKLSSSEVRSSFIDFFVNQHDHQFYRSSSVKPSTNDQSLLFVNAGMNQFKPIFLGQIDDRPEFEHFKQLKRAVNSQKCIRVGGKHCDLENVGSDFTHHTFFEMLGNWSFNDYFKKEACQMAWTLLTQVYRIDPSRLFVTIFGGDERLGLKTDLESYETWRSIGVPSDRIIPLGIKDNFWEMGETGPCGICTEIHYELNHIDPKVMDYHARLLENSFEIWNIVFIQYFRDESRSLKRLEKNFVDTGMGLERILSLVQGVPNNYATDLFTPYFDKISKICKWPEYSHHLEDPKDIAYRILADHSRMICVAIADQVKPDDRGAGYLLRRVLRRAIDAIRTIAEMHRSLPTGIDEVKLLTSLAESTIESLGNAFPELEENVSLIFQIIEEEVRLYTTALTRNVQLMKLSDSLQIKLSENDPQLNRDSINQKLEHIKLKIQQFTETNLSQTNNRVNQHELELIRREYAQLYQLSTMDKSLSTRFGLTSKNIENNFELVENELTETETNLDKVLQDIIEQFEVEARKKLLDCDTFSILSISNDCITGRRPLDFFLLKIATDLFGTERPFTIVLRQSEEDALLLQLNVPNHSMQTILEAQAWFDLATRSMEEGTELQVFPIKNKRPKRVVRFRVKLAEDDDVSNIDDIGQNLYKCLCDIGKKHFR